MAESFQSFSGAKVLRRTRQSLERARLAVLHWAHPDDNPFLQKALRLEARRGKPFFTVAVVALLNCLTCLVLWKLWLLLQATIAKTYADGWAYRFWMRLQTSITSIFGENPIGWFALATALVSACAVLWSSRARVASLLRQEVLKNTLVQLQQLPIAEERWLWLMTAHPALIGVLVGGAGLPIYALAVFTGQWSTLDVLGLFVLYFLLAHTPPAWLPAAWQQANAKTSPAKLTWRQWHEAIKQSQSAAQTGDLAGSLEMQRRLQRSLGGLDTEHSPSEPKSGDGKKPNVAPFMFRNNARGSSAFGWIWASIVFSFFMQATRIAGFSTLQQLTETWPPEAVTLLRAFPLTWPLLISKLLFAPIGFFSFALPPVVLVIPLWLGFSHQGFVTLAGNVSAAETFWTAPRLQRRAIVNWLLTAGVLLFIFGYGWRVLIQGGELARLIRGAVLTPSWAIAAGWTLAIVAGTLGAGMTLEAPFKRAAAGALSTVQAWRESTRCIARSLLFAIGAYFLFCWLGSRTGINAIWLERLPVTVATCVAFLLADFGSAALAATMEPSLRRGWNLLRMAWFHLLGFTAMAIIVYSLWGGWSKRVFSFDDASLILLSPFVTLFSLFRVNAALPIAKQPMLWIALIIQAVIGMVCLLLAHRAIFKVSVSEAAVDESAPTTTSTERAWLAPLRAMGEIVIWPLNFLSKKLEGWLARIHACNHKLVQWGERMDNPILTYELRRRVPKENWAWQWIAFFFGEAILFFSIARPWELWSIGAQGGGGIVSGARGYINFYEVWGTQVTYTVLSLLAFTGVLSCLSIGRAFDADRANGTLVFLFLTPQTDRAILFGKWMIGIIHVGGVLSTGLLWLAAGVAATFLGAWPLTVVSASCGIIAIVTAVLMASSVNLFFAVKAKKPTEGQGWALLACVLIQGGLGIGLSYAMIYLNDALPQTPDELLFSILLLPIALVQGVLAYVAWRLALAAFGKRRYGDVEASGKGAS